jgi:hypothetical protein
MPEPLTLAAILQVWIALTGLPALLLLNLGYPWPSVIGLCGQPAWWIATYRKQQWGMFVLTLAYTVSWGAGVIRWLS